ncbi:hypothetical protein TrRE_jg13089 [Triparma retinervis]|uniref:Uncharacterized protein n=1 Tax=Triparma retinervis TaxID=2557542 RepID=A0A9W7G8B8_9STRA|nr:hypothetical protein TrRE_jg13089 [Triparma retinervis]
MARSDSALTRFLLKSDKFARPHEESGTNSLAGGFCSLSTYFLLAIYLAFYVASHLNASFPTVTSIVVFPQKTSSDIVKLPPVTCMAESGCWYKPTKAGETDRRRLTRRWLNEGDAPDNDGQNPPPNNDGQNPPDNNDGQNPPNNNDGQNPPNNNDGQNPPNNNDGQNPPNNNNPPENGDDNVVDASADNACYYLAQGEVIPEEHRRIVHDSDPIDSFTAVWGDTQNFGLSYDVTTVTKAGLTLETETIMGRKSLTEPFEGAVFQVYKGETLFSLVKTVGVAGDEVDTWTNTVMGEDGTPDAQQNTCCHAETTKNPNTGATYTESEYILFTGPGTSRCDDGANDGVYQVKIRPFPTYSLEEVQNPLEPLTLWAALAGEVVGEKLGAFLKDGAWSVREATCLALAKLAEKAVLGRKLVDLLSAAFLHTTADYKYAKIRLAGFAIIKALLERAKELIIVYFEQWEKKAKRGLQDNDTGVTALASAALMKMARM